MTITLTVEEIKEYQKRLDKWYAERYAAFHAARTRSYAQGGPLFAGHEFGAWTEYTEQWDRENPAPTLLPRL